MKRIAFITVAALALLATAAAAHQSGRGNAHRGDNGNVQRSAYTAGGCSMGTNMGGPGMMYRGATGTGFDGNTTPRATTGHGHGNHPAYQGRGDMPATGN